MNKSREIKQLLHSDLSRTDKLLLLLKHCEAPCKPQRIREAGIEAGFKVPAKWNISGILRRSRGLAFQAPEGWELSENGYKRLHELGAFATNPHTAKVRADLRVYLTHIQNEEVKAFVEEAIKCHEAELHKSAIIMSWLAAMAVMHTYVLQNELTAFNLEAQRVDPKWKPAKTPDDLALMKESQFLDRLQTLSIIGKNVKKKLIEALDTRNGCGHPSSLRVSVNQAAAHLEFLLQNVFSRLQIN